MSNETKTPEADGKTTTQAQQPAPTENKSKGKGKATGGNRALRSVGLAACRRHELPEVWVTADGMAFAQESDAKAHSRNLENDTILKVTAK